MTTTNANAHRFDDFARELIKGVDRAMMIKMLAFHDFDIIDFIDALFDDDFAIITDDDDNAYSIFLEYIEHANATDRAYLTARIAREITIILAR